MDRQRRPCRPQLVERFLDDRLQGEHLAAFEDHLEQCPTCRQYLDSTAAEGSWWQEARGHLAAVGPSLGEDGGLPDLGGVENYLAPTDDPRMLGRLGSYEIQGVVGTGGMGVVLKGFDASLNRHVAIKVLAPSMANDGAARQRFAREARAAATVVHDNVMAIHAVAEANALPYFVMPYVRGPSLEKRLRETGAFAVVEVLRIGMQIAFGLAAAHAQGLVHRDIKPANILLEEGTDRVRITDFGLARAVDDASLTRSGVIAGTPEYMSPEQAAGGFVDPRSDLFSLGSVLYAMCTGRPPFRASSTLAVLRRVEEGRPRPIREVNPDIPDYLAAIVGRLHAREPGDRFEGAAEVAALLEGHLAHLQQPATVPPPPLPPPPGGLRRHRTQLVGPLLRRLGLRALVLIAGVGLGVSLSQPAAPGGQGDPRLPAVFYQSFKDNQDQKSYHLIGPDAEQCVRFEPEGLRLTLPAGHEGLRPGTGVASEFSVVGDFEITVGFEILQEPTPAEVGGAFYLAIKADSPVRKWATLNRAVRPQGGRMFTAWLSPATPNVPEKGKGVIHRVLTDATSGQLRLARAGASLSYSVAEGSSKTFTILAQGEYGEEDLKAVEIVGATGGPRASLDVRIRELCVRAESLPGVPAPLVLQAGGRRWSVIALASFAAVALAFGSWVTTRRLRTGGSPSRR